MLVIGGGVIGGMCAWYLHRAGYRVTVMDQGQFGAACSHGNCGYVCPSHVLPLCQPGAVAKTMKAMLRRNSPFAVRPRASLALVPVPQGDRSNAPPGHRTKLRESFEGSSGGPKNST